MATKKPAPRAATLDDLIASGYRYGGSLDPLPQAPAAEPTTESRGAVRGAADLGLSFGRGAVQGVRMFTDLAGADNAVSSGLRSVEDFIGGLRSAQAKQDDQAIAAILKEAEGKGVLDQVVAGFRAFAQAPGSTMAQALGTSVPTIAAALATGGAAPGAALAARAVPAAVGALQGTGAVKGSIYDEVYRRALTEGRTEEEARALAEQAQAYSGDNAGQLALGAGLGALAGGSGLERGVQALRGGVTTEAPGIARRVGMGALAEGIPEALQGGQEKYATNVAQDRAGFPTDPMAGVVASGTMEAIAGGAMGGAFGIPRPPQRPGDELRKDKLPESGPMTRALNQGVEAAAQAADKGAPIPPELTDAPGATPPPQGMEFEADPRFENTPTFGNGQAPAAQSTGAPAQADEGTAPQAPVAPVLQPEMAPEETSLAPGASEPPGPVQPGDVTMKNGKPFAVKNNGLLRAFERRLGPGYVRTPVEGGIVLRKVGGDGPVAEDAQPGAADDGAVAGDPVLRGGDTEPVAAGEPAPGPVGAAVPGDPAAQLRPGEPEPAAELTPTGVPASDPRVTREQAAPEPKTAPAADPLTAAQDEVKRLTHLYRRAGELADKKEEARLKPLLKQAREAVEALKPATRTETPAPVDTSAGRVDAAETKRLNDAIVEARKPAPQTATTASGYTLPDNVGDDWAATRAPGSTPTERQALVMAAVERALDDGVFYNRDMDARVAQELGVTPEMREPGKGKVEGGWFGYDVYLARQVVEARRERENETRLSGALSALKPGDSLGTLMFNDGKQVRSTNVEAIEGQSIVFTGKRGPVKVQGKVSPSQLKRAIERAHEREARKDGFDAFVARLTKPDAAIETSPEPVEEAALSGQVAAAPAPQAPPQGRAPEAAAPVAEPVVEVPLPAEAAPADTLRTELQQVEQQILAAAPGRFAKGGGDIEAAAKRKEVPAALKERRKALKAQIRAADAAPKPEPAPAPAPEPAPPPAAEPAPAPEPPARTPEQARTIELKKRLKVLEALRRCVG